jgi:malonate transporter
MLTEFITLLDFAFGVTGPIFTLVFLGILLKKFEVIDDAFTLAASRLVYMVAMPTMLFISMINTDIRSVVDGSYLIFAVCGSLVIFAASSLLCPLLVKERRDRGVFIQGTFRSNLAIVGLAFCFNAYGEPGLAKASILMSVLTILYNLLTAYTLSASLSSEQVRISKVLIGIIKNPLIAALVIGIIFSLMAVPIPDVVRTSGEYLARMTLPLALISIGSALSFSELKNSSSVSVMAVFTKLVIVPVTLTYTAYRWGIQGMDLGILFLMVASPTAVASYIMVQNIGGNAKLAASIVVISTIASLITVSFGLAVLKQIGVI